MAQVKPAGTLAIVQEGDDALRLSGDVDDAGIEGVCDRVKQREFLLIDRGFHGINEQLFSR